MRFYSGHLEWGRSEAEKSPSPAMQKIVSWLDPPAPPYLPPGSPLGSENVLLDLLVGAEGPCWREDWAAGGQGRSMASRAALRCQ